MIQKIKAAIKAKFPHINFTQKKLTAIAANIEKKVVDDETLIDATIDALNELYPFAEIGKDDDRVRNLELQLKKAAPAKKEDGSEEDEEETPESKKNTEKKPETDNAVLAILKELKGEIQTLKSEKVQNTIQTTLAEKLKDVPAIVDWQEWRQPEKPEDIDAFVEKVQTKAKEREKDFTEKGLTGISAPKSGEKSDPSKAKQASKEEVESVVNNIM